jgi:hypothetical protein
MSADVADRASASSPVAPPEVTRLLRRWSDGDRCALDRLMPLLRAATVDRQLHLANAWLARALAEDRS